MTTATLAVICTVGAALVGIGAVVAKTTWAAAREVSALRLDIAGLRLEIVTRRAADREAYRELVDDLIERHRDNCQGVRGRPTGPVPLIDPEVLT